MSLLTCSGDHRAGLITDMPLLYAVALGVHNVHRIAVRRQSMWPIQLVRSATVAVCAGDDFTSMIAEAIPGAVLVGR